MDQTNTIVIDKVNTPDEVIDVVDLNDNVIGTTTKKVANSNPDIIHREVGVLVYDNHNRVLLQQRHHKKHKAPLEWTLSACGHVPSGMATLDAAHMELHEELSIKATIEFKFKKHYKHTNEQVFFTYFHAKFDLISEVKFNPEEVEDVKWVSKQELADMIRKGEKIEPHALADVLDFFNEN